MLKSIKRRAKRLKHITFEYTGNNGEDIPINVTHVRVLPGVTKIEYRAKFYRKVRLESITIPSTVIEIGQEAFMHCNGLREVVFNDCGIKTIGYSAFFDCKSLESIIFPSTLTEIGNSAFANCNNLRTIVLNEGLRTIKGHGFESCSSLQSITLPSTLTSVGNYAFGGCDRLREIVILNESLDRGISIIKQVMLACISVRKLNFPGLSTRLENIFNIDYWADVIVDKIDAIPQIVRRDSGGFLISTRDRENRVDWKLVKQRFDKMHKLISYYELKEATSLFELALWKAKIDQVDDVVELASRDAYRCLARSRIQYCNIYDEE